MSRDYVKYLKIRAAILNEIAESDMVTEMSNYHALKGASREAGKIADLLENSMHVNDELNKIKEWVISAIGNEEEE